MQIKTSKPGKYRVHKHNNRTASPLVSIILLDWSCRERFHALDWLRNQNVSEDQYELIWVELFERVVEKALQASDVLITCGEQGSYHKHIGYNAGLLESRGQVIVVCDSDAVYPPNFVESIIKAFRLIDGKPEPLVLMHYEWRTGSQYPEGLTSIDQLSEFKWLDLWPNVGACVSVRKSDAVHFGGFDEDESYRGFVCGPYDLAWRLVNAGVEERWHDSVVALWHFAHPAPYFHASEFSLGNLIRMFEVESPHCEYHALPAVEAFSTGRLLPLQENLEVHKLRMSLRRIGSEFEQTYSARTGPEGFSKSHIFRLRLVLIRERFMRLAGVLLWYGVKTASSILKTLLGPARFEMLKKKLSLNH